VGSVVVEIVLLMFDVVIVCWVDARHSAGTGKDRRLQVTEKHPQSACSCRTALHLEIISKCVPFIQSNVNLMTYVRAVGI
jgi:hypothetical protein